MKSAGEEKRGAGVCLASGGGPPDARSRSQHTAAQRLMLLDMAMRSGIGTPGKTTRPRHNATREQTSAAPSKMRSRDVVT
jgi:hypothetical protein